jgi:hypothetical protein
LDEVRVDAGVTRIAQGNAVLASKMRHICGAEAVEKVILVTFPLLLERSGRTLKWRESLAFRGLESTFKGDLGSYNGRCWGFVLME